MALALRRRQGPSKFEQAADGSMTLIEHVRELRNRLFFASLGLIFATLQRNQVRMGDDASAAAAIYLGYRDRTKRQS